MPSKIILSYRRSDSDVITGRIRDNLANRYGEDAIFMDIDSIPLGFDYRKQMKDALAENKVMIAVIGPKWVGGRGKDARINADNDPVRIELETALQQGTPIIPVHEQAHQWHRPDSEDGRISAIKTDIEGRTGFAWRRAARFEP